MKKARLKPYRNWTEKELQITLLNHLDRIEMPSMLRYLWQDLISEAFESDLRDVVNEYNGCTIVQDWLHPDPACFCHDYMWITGHGGKEADNIFKLLMSAEGMPKQKIYRRKLGVRLGWFFGYFWKYKLRGELKEPTKTMIDLLNYIR